MTIRTEQRPQPHRLTVVEYYRMAEVGLLPQDGLTELIEGEIIDMPPIGHRHAALVDRLARRLIQAAGELAHVRIQNPVRLSTVSEPQPDLALLRPRRDGYMNAHPTVEDTLLIVEVCEATLDYDRNVKVPLYARHGVPEVWLIDLTNDRLHVFREPRDGRYAAQFAMGCTDAVTIPTMSATIALGDLLEPIGDH